jgi:hypothetical protein
VNSGWWHAILSVCYMKFSTEQHQAAVAGAVGVLCADKRSSMVT